MPIKEKLLSAKNHIYAKRARYTAVATLVVCYAVSRGAVNEWNTFLADRNLTDEYYRNGEE